MKYVFDNLDKIKKNLAYSKWVLLLDFDLTLSPLAKNPANALLPEETKILLKKLSENVPTAILTGRTIKDVKKKVGIKNIVYVGNHGLEYEISNKKKFFTLNSLQKKGFKYIKQEFARLRKKYRGVIVEDKKFSLALHYRLLPKKEWPPFVNELNNLRVQAKAYGLTEVLYKKTLEVKSDTEEDKGTASLFLLKKFGKSSRAIYIGDGKTDEDAFRALNKEVTIRVGKSKHSAAKYYVNNVIGVKKFLQWLLDNLLL